MEKVRVEIVGMSYSHSQSGTYTMILGEVGGDMKLPITIGGAEAQAIALKLEGISQSRPMTHDLLLNVIRAMHGEIREVLICKFRNGIFYAELHIQLGDKLLKIDSRTSDAVALALRADIPVFVYRDILDKAGLVIKSEGVATAAEEEEESTEKGSALGDMSLAELEDLLDELVENEEFEKASLVRDEIKRRKGEA